MNFPETRVRLSCPLDFVHLVAMMPFGPAGFHEDGLGGGGFHTDMLGGGVVQKGLREGVVL